MPPERPDRPRSAPGPRRFAGELGAQQIIPVATPTPPPRTPPPRPLPTSTTGRHARIAPAAPKRSRRTSTFARTVVALTSCAVLAATGLAWKEARSVQGGFRTSDVLAGAPKSVGTAENILLIGLDSRKDQNGNDLPPAVLAQLHAGDGEEGGYNTNTLILIHVPADGKNVVAFSIPRDDYVPVDGIKGYDHAKIKEAYGLMKAQAAQELVDSGVTDQATIEAQSRDAGRAETLKTVRALTGVPIDRFAEVNLVGFYDITKALGGVKVCLNHAVSDSYSGAHFSAGVHTLNASQALAFVRQRHGLDNGDLDRTHRQQAFLVSVTHALSSSGVFGDLSKLNALVSVAQKDITLSSGWDIIDYAHRIGDISGQSTRFTTLPVLRYDSVDGQDVNIIDSAAIKTQVQTAFGVIPPAPTTSASGTPAPSSSADSLSSTATADDPAPDQGAPVTTSQSGVPCVN